MFHHPLLLSIIYLILAQWICTYTNYAYWYDTIYVAIYYGLSLGTLPITFISSAWGGRVSDKVITQQCGFLSFIDPGDVILADRGFNVHNEIAIKGRRLEIPAFTKGKSM